MFQSARDGRRLLSILTIFLLSAAAFASAPTMIGKSQEKPKSSIDQTLNMLDTVHNFKEVAISPDGARVAWVEAINEKNHTPSSHSTVYVAKVGTPTPHRIAAGAGSAASEDHSVAWSPDSARLAFLSDREKPGQLQLYVASITESGAGNIKRLTQLTGFLDNPRWSPDGKSLAFLFTENAAGASGPLQPKAADAGVVDEKIFEQRLAIVDLASGQVRQISPPEQYIHEYDWSPDGKSVAAVAAPGSGDDNWFIAQLYTISIATGEMKSIASPKMQIAEPRWSPDGKNIAFIGGLMSDETVNGGDIYVVPANGGQPRDLTPVFKASPASLAWSSATGEIIFTENIDGATGLASVDLQGDTVKTIWTGAESVLGEAGDFGISLSRDGKTSAVIRHSFQHAPEVWAGPVGSWQQVTHANQEFHASWGEPKSMHWTSDGKAVQGWLLYPSNYDPNRRYPMVVSIHGGPASAKRPTWPTSFFDFTLLSPEGYFVFFPNPRGSYGQGEAFTSANVKDFGYGDLRDILAGVDEVIKTVPIDSKRIGIGGWSYGGYMTMWAVTQTNRFRASVAGAGLANWQSYYGENGIDQWMIPYFGASVYDDPAVYAKSSPINYIKNVKTPTLVLVGDSDIECPTPQSYEFWHALKTIGVKTELVIYPHEGHRIMQPEHRRDIMQRTISWFNENMK